MTHIGYVFLSDNNALAGLELTGLSSIDGSLTVNYMAGLTSLSGLDALSSVGGEIELIGDDQLSPDEIRAFKERLGW